jgi:hypothetical protein
VRVYLPATLSLLEKWLADGEAAAVGEAAYAVTAALRESYLEADLDELEHAAQIAASIGSLRLLASDADVARRRVVLAVEADDALVRPDSPNGRASVRLTGRVPVVRWASALIDAPDVEAVIEDAVGSLTLAAVGDDDAQFALDEAEAHELGWYAVQELPHLFA